LEETETGCWKGQADVDSDMIDLIARCKWWLFGIILLGGLACWFESWRSHREHSQDAVILAAGRKHDVDPALIKAVVWRESWFNPNAKGTSGEVGLMQIMKDTANDWAAAQRVTLFTHSQLYDPAKNTDCGAWYLRKLLTRYRGTDNPVVYALAAYNAGPGRVAKWSQGGAATNNAEFLQQMDFGGTKKYVLSVSERYQHYRRSFPPKPG
jgi:soluble lytic murein transglycosylase